MPFESHLRDPSLTHRLFHGINIEREALDLPLIDLSQAFGMVIPVSRSTVDVFTSEAMPKTFVRRPRHAAMP